MTYKRLSNLVSCIICKEQYSTKGLFTHFSRTHQNKTRSNNKQQISISLKLRNFDILIKNLKNYYSNPRFCTVCNTEIDYFKRHNKSCSKQCSAKIGNKSEYRQSEEYKSKMKTAVAIKREQTPKKEPVIWGPYTRIYLIKCKISGEMFYSKTVKQISDSAKTEKRLYREKCSFKFDVYKYPEEFDIQLLKIYGWYSAKNKGDNFEGCARDHMISVSYGLTHKIDPKIISHPANCQIIQNKENQKKRGECSLTLNQLLLRIKMFDEKYGHTGEFRDLI